MSKSVDLTKESKAIWKHLFGVRWPRGMKVIGRPWRSETCYAYISLTDRVIVVYRHVDLNSLWDSLAHEMSHWHSQQFTHNKQFYAVLHKAREKLGLVEKESHTCFIQLRSM